MSDQERRDENNAAADPDAVDRVDGDDRPYCGRCGHPARMHQHPKSGHRLECSWPGCDCWNLKEEG